MRKLGNLISVYVFMEQFFPGLVRYDNYKFYLSDATVSEYSITYQESTSDGPIRFYGTDFEIMIYLSSGRAYGHFYMDYDFGLSVDSCMGFYKHDMVIYALNDQNVFIPYDRESIERRHTIENIIKD